MSKQQASAVHRPTPTRRADPGAVIAAHAAELAQAAEEARALRHARYNRLRRLAQEEGLPVHLVMTGRAVPRGFTSILDRAGRIRPDPIDFDIPVLVAQ